MDAIYYNVDIENIDDLGDKVPEPTLIRMPCVFKKVHIEPHRGRASDSMRYCWDISITAIYESNFSEAIVFGIYDSESNAERLEWTRKYIEQLINDQNVIIVESQMPTMELNMTLYAPTLRVFAKDGGEPNLPAWLRRFPGMVYEGFDPALEAYELEHLGKRFLSGCSIQGTVILLGRKMKGDFYDIRWRLREDDFVTLCKSGFKDELSKQLRAFMGQRQRANHVLADNAEVIIKGDRLSIEWLPDDMASLIANEETDWYC